MCVCVVCVCVCVVCVCVCVCVSACAPNVNNTSECYRKIECDPQDSSFNAYIIILHYFIIFTLKVQPFKFAFRVTTNNFRVKDANLI